MDGVEDTGAISGEAAFTAGLLAFFTGLPAAFFFFAAFFLAGFFLPAFFWPLSFLRVFWQLSFS